MRIIAGSRRGTKLYTGRMPGFRPTSDRVREALFSILGDRVEGCRMLDLFAGSGAVGLEALSRGAAEVLFVEKNSRVVSWIERNARDLRFEERSTVCTGDAISFLSGDARAARFDIVFADPPYRAGLVAPLVECLIELPGERTLVLERDKREAHGLAVASWRRPAVYGDTVVEFLTVGPGEVRRPEEEIN